MKHLFVFLLLFILVPVAIFLVWGHLFPEANVKATESRTGRSAHPRPALGVSSCAASACHHGNGPAGQVGSEYTTWASSDPHARAYLVLFDERSRAIQDNLNRAEPPAR